MSIIITTLIDNRAQQQPSDLLTEHGLSFLVEMEKSSWLYDVGASKGYAENALLLQKELSSIQGLVLSHGHADHTGGLAHFIAQNPNTPIFASPSIITERYFSARHSTKKEISTDASLLKNNRSFREIKNSCWLTANLAIVMTKKHPYALPKGNKYLTKRIGTEEEQDLFEQEITLALRTSTGLVLLSACSHNGVLNIMQACAAYTQCNTIRHFIGGTHLLDKMADDLPSIAQEIRKNYPTTQFHIGHCTGQNSLKELQNELPDQVEAFYSGWTMPLE